MAMAMPSNSMPMAGPPPPGGPSPSRGPSMSSQLMAMSAKMEKHRGGDLDGASRGPSGLFGASGPSDLFDVDFSSQREVV